MKNNQKLFVTVSWLFIILTLIFISVLTFWSIYPYNPIEFKSSVYKVLTPVVRPGDILKYELEYCKNSDIVPLVTRYYVDGIIFETPTGRGVVTRGCHKQIVNNIVPMNLLPGKYRMKVVVDYKVNPIRNIIYNNITEEFTVIERK